ncbi:Pectinacetylesterase [Enhygromyxa salina]|uniref:Pectinacetylesterase n=2 Tax=Enhygromyxa salina TaxID=215803 RepID=A0A2S9YE75_9BACT|nr:Pectinacetylesterase [Enhygromyxa salina]
MSMVLCACASSLALGCADDGASSSETGASSETAADETTTPATGSADAGSEDSGDGEASDDETETGPPPADMPEAPDPDPDPIYDGEPLPEAPPGEWNWIDIPEAECIDGSPTGIGVRYGISDEVVIFFEGGGGCFNEATCGLFYASFANFDELTFDLLWQNTVLQGGIFSTLNGDNPVRDWNFIYVPYCTGDVHAGAAPDTAVPGFAFGAPQQFVGFTNVHHFLDRIVPTFKDETSHVLVTGISAGGFGAAFNYDRIADAFAGSKVTLIDDSGPPLSDAYLVPCLQQTWRDLFNLDATIPAACEECFGDDGGGIGKLANYMANKHADQTLGFISAERDLVIRTFFGYGIQNEGGEQCPPGIIELPMNPDYFEAGIYSLRTTISPQPNWGSYLMAGTSHTSLSFPNYYLTNVNGVRMVDWVANMLEGQTSHVSP